MTVEELLTKALALEQLSEHPLAKAVTAEGTKRQLTASPVAGFKALPGMGVQGMLEGKELLGGSPAAISQRVNVSEKMLG